MNWLPLFRRRHSWTVSIDAFVDGDLDAGEAARFESHLETCAECASAVAETRAMTSALSALPELEPPRSFRISPEMLAEPAPAPPPPAQPAWYPRAAAGLMAAAIGVFAVLVVVDAGGSGGNDAMRASVDLNGEGAPEAAGMLGPDDGAIQPDEADPLERTGDATLAGDAEPPGPMLTLEDPGDSSFNSMRAAQIAAAAVAAGALGAFVVTRRRTETG